MVRERRGRLDVGQEIRAQKTEISEPANDDAGNAEVVGNPSTRTADLLGSTSDGSASCSGAGTRDLWYRFTAPVWPGTLEVDTCGTNDKGGTDSGMDSVLSIHSGSPGTSANELACNDDWPVGSLPTHCTATDLGNARDSATSAALVGGQSVWIRVSHYQTSVPGPFDLHVRYVPEPSGLLLLAGGLGGLFGLQRRRERNRADRRFDTRLRLEVR